MKLLVIFSFTTLVVVSLVVSFVFFRYSPFSSDPSSLRSFPTPTASPIPQVGDIVEFSAILTDFIDTCAMDGVCWAVTKQGRIVTNVGNLAEPILFGTSNVWSNHIGEEVYVRAIFVKEGMYTLEGDEGLYVKLVAI